MKTATRDREGRGAEAGFTLVEALVAIVVLIFGLMAVTNLMLVAASSNTVANQGTAAVTSATRVMDMLKTTTFTDLTTGGTTFDTADGGDPCDDPDLSFDAWHCSDAVPGVGVVHTHWWITATDETRLLHIRVQSEGTGALTGARSRAEFTTFRACTTPPDSDPGTPDCPV
jgi:Tfp pilus assembly protein PilV